MFKTIIFLAIIFFTPNFFGQNINYGPDSVTITFDSDKYNQMRYYEDEIMVLSTQDVNVSGEFSSDDSVVIIPKNSYSIVLLPIDNSNNRNTFQNGTTTVITAKSGGFGRPYSPQVSIYPNPVHSDLTFNSPESKIIAYSIYDQTGATIMSSSIIPSNIYTINVSNLINGIYILKLNMENGSSLSTIQFIKN